MLIKIEQGTPLLGVLAYGIIDRGTNLLQVRPTSVCNINCTFCSVDGGSLSTKHAVFYEVNCAYLLEEVGKVVARKGYGVEINIDSVGEPFCYPHLEELVNGLRKIGGVQRITIQTNATILKDIDVDLINVSFHAMDPKLAMELANSPCFSIDHVKKFVETYRTKSIAIRLCPVWIPGVNDMEIPKIIQYAKEQGCSLGIQKYEAYKYSRKHSGAVPVTWWKFYRQIEVWEKAFGVPLKVTARELGIHRAPRVPEVFRSGERVQLEVRYPGWFQGQMIAVGRDRCVSVKGCEKHAGDFINVRMLETKNNIYVAE